MTKENLETIKNALTLRRNMLSQNVANSNFEIDALQKNTAVDEADFAKICSETTLADTLIRQCHVELSQIDSALERIKNGNYGVCEMCDDEISFERLNAKPHTRFCKECRNVAERSRTR